MTELEVKLVKVDNWGIFFLQRLKHFFNRTDYCDLTLQFQDNAQLKVHRLVLSACTEYFELLERTCEMYEDCLVMPDDLQADVVVPIVNFMYTGQLEFRMDLLERLYQTSQIMNMPVLTKLLEAHRNPPKAPTLNYNSIKRSYSKSNKDQTSRNKQSSQHGSTSNNSLQQQSSKRSFTKAFGNVSKESHNKTMALMMEKRNETHPEIVSTMAYTALGNSYLPKQKVTLGEPRPTRYELPEELDTDNVFDNSFASISYSSQPFVVHPNSEKQTKSKRSGLFDESNNSESVVDIIDCTKVPKRENIFDDDAMDPLENDFMPDNQSHVSSNQLFDQIAEKPCPKVTIETKDSNQASNIDHAKIISEVLKKYPHLVKSNKNIKLKILNPPSPPQTTYKSRSKKQQQMSPIQPPPHQEEHHAQRAKQEADYTYESDVLDSKQAARLIAMGADNIKGPWICLICGTPGKALHFGSYYKFRRHLVEVHKEKPIVNMCEYCGLKSLKRNYLLHHLLTKHGVPPPPTHNFPKCNSCDYVALSETLLVKHKLSHGQDHRRFRCNICVANFNTSKELLAHIQLTGHKYCDRKTNLQCVYCQKVFLRESNLFAHLKTYHKQLAKADGIIEDSEDEMYEPAPVVKYEPQSYDDETDDIETQYQIRPDGNLELVVSKKTTTNTIARKQKILNTGFGSPAVNPVQKVHKSPVKAIPPPPPAQKKYNDEVVIIGNNEYIMRDNQLIPKKRTGHNIIIPEMGSESPEENMSSDYTLQDTMAESTLQEQRMIMKKATSMNQPIQIVVSSEEEYKALMNSNHSIIFDDGDASKTLTVLSTPETPMHTTMDLENNESTDMMIIQDNYPINVSQGIAPNSSNIVVVYSQPVDQQNKQYQIISSRDIGSQFVQSAPVVSQNYQTVTTSASLTSSQVMDTQASGSWQIDLQQGNQRNDEIQELHEMSIEETTDVTTPVTVVPNVLSGLPEVSLTSIPSQQEDEVIITHEASEHTKPDETSVENMVENHENVDEPQQITQTIVDSDMPTTVVISSTPLVAEDTSTEMEIIDVSHQQAVTEIPVTEEVNVNKNPREQSSENVDAEHIQSSQITDNIVEQTDLTETNEDSQEHDTTEVESQITPQDLFDAQSASEGNVVKVPIEKIQNLTSEWSEDEEDIIRHQNVEKDNKHEQANVTEKSQEMEDSNEQGIVIAETQELEQGIVTEESQEIEDSHEQGIVTDESQEMENSHEQGNVTEDSQDVEESIENIQNEVEKQVNKVSEQLIIMESSSSAKLQDQPSSAAQVAAPHEKISSILNDWEENESQEGSTSANGKGESDPTEIVEGEAIEGESAVASDEGTGSKKEDKIQSLVSDWDEEEEEKV